MLKEYLIDTNKYQVENTNIILEKVANAVKNYKTLIPNVSTAIISIMNDFVNQLTPYVQQKVDTQFYRGKLNDKDREEINYSRSVI
ncbi:MAG: hypothetical protein ACP5NC_08425 [Nitrososphaeria archaeon]